ncbi:MAG: alpha,alpha-trehalase [Calditrichaeota bacterium]|nr:alpha,alpha-trehalase [Calditrichota bacterium]
MTQKDFQTIYHYIEGQWQRSVRFTPKNQGTIIGMPYPYTVPCPDEDVMQNYFYWDTFFINVGLLEQGQVSLARDNVDNLLFMVQKYGFVPNGNQTYFLNRSQPPFLLLMIRDVFQHTQDREWLRQSYKIWKIEYDFWMQHRMTPIGLNQHLNHATDQELIEFYEHELKTRLGFSVSSTEKKITIAHHHLAEAETGWDFTPRFGKKCANYINLELNAILYLSEKTAGEVAEILGHRDASEWQKRAEKRRKLYLRYHWNEKEKIFSDYDFVNKRHSQIASLATFAPLWAEIATHEQAKAVAGNLGKFEFDFGVAVCENSESKIIYQWDFPNGWPPIFYLTIAGLEKYNFHEEARRIAEKYLTVVAKNFQETNALWEKYNVTDGSVNVKDEYKMPSMLGWTAGVFVFCYNFLFGN